MHRLRYEVFTLGEPRVIRAIVGEKRAANLGVRDAEEEMFAAHALHAKMEPALAGRNIRMDGILRIRACGNLHRIHAYRIVGTMFQGHRIDAHDFFPDSLCRNPHSAGVARVRSHQHREKCRCKDLPFHRPCVMRQIEERRGLFPHLRKVFPADSVLLCCHGLCFSVQDTNFFRGTVSAVQYAVWFSSLHTFSLWNAVFAENRFRLRFTS